MPQPHSGLVRHSAIISFFSGLGVLSGLVVDLIIAAIFGIGLETDAFFLAATIPLLLPVIMSVSAEQALVPQFANTRIERGTAVTWQMFSILFNYSVVVFAGVALLGVVVAGPLMNIIAAGLDAQGKELAKTLCQIMFIGIAFSGPMSVQLAMLNSHQQFHATASRNLVRSLVIISVMWFTRNQHDIRAVAWGYLIAGVIQVLVLLVALRRIKMAYNLSFDRHFPGLAKAARSWALPATGLAIRQSSQLVERLLASFLSAGAVTVLIYARRIIAAIINVLLNSVPSAVLPVLSSYGAGDQKAAFLKTLASGIKLVATIALPMTIYLLLLSQPLARVLFRRGAVTETDVASIAALLSLYALGLPFLGAIQILLAPHYSLRDTRTPVFHDLLMVGVNLVLALALFPWLGAAGLALALSLTGVISVGRAVWLLRRRFGKLPSDLYRFLAQMTGASLLMGVMVYFSRVVLERMLSVDVLFHQVLMLAVTGIVALLGLGLAAWLLHIPEAAMVMLHLRRHLVPEPLVE
jgi:putative peptidoglycan lipid II flippase